MMLLFCYIAVLLPSIASAHVKLFFNGALSIRNAGSGATSDGRFSVSGPCGGANTFGLNGVNNKVTDGDEVCLTINYNGAHKSPANKFRAVFQCGEPQQQNSFVGLTSLPLKEKPGVTSQIDPSGDEVSAPQGNSVQEGYTLCVDLPEQNLNSASSLDQRRCTLSILEQRQWGGCIDMELQDKPPAPTPSPVPAPIAEVNFNDLDAEGVYSVTFCDKDAGGKCCLKGNVGIISEGNGKVFGKLTSVSHEEFDGTTPDEETATLCQEFSKTFSIELSWEGDAAGTFVGNTEIQAITQEAQAFEVLIRDVKANGLNMFNIGENSPLVSDATLSYTTTLEDGLAQGLVTLNEDTDVDDSSESGGGTSVAAISVIVLAAIGMFVGAFLYNKRNDSASSTSNSALAATHPIPYNVNPNFQQQYPQKPNNHY